MHLKRIVATLATAAAAVGTLSLGAGSASADEHPLVNTYITTWTKPAWGGPVSALDECRAFGQDSRNQAEFGSVDPWNHGGEQYYYCAPAENDKADLWLRHQV